MIRLTTTSVESILTQMLDTFKRFPLAIISAIAGVIVACLLVHLKHTHTNYNNLSEIYIKILMTCYLSTLLFISIPIFIQKIQLSLLKNILLQSICLGLMIIYFYFLTPTNPLELVAFIHFVLYVLGLHLLVSFIPFITTNSDTNGFWQYNKILFLRILTSGLYSSVFYVGIILALFSIEKLFDVKINYDLYIIDLWIVIVGIFNTWFFLAGLPENITGLNSLNDYPKGLKIFTQYILLPLVGIYLLILYAYEIKIFITSQWPMGWVAYLVLCFSIVGILPLLLIWPIQNQKEHRWMRAFSRFFYIALFPLILLLFLAIYKRVSQYGITENRYFILLLALWLTGISLYFLLSKTKNIKWIPVTLCLACFFSTFGPWSAFSISKTSQLRRMEQILTNNKMLDNSKHLTKGKELSSKDEIELNFIVEYLVSTHGINTFQPYLHENLNSIIENYKKSKNQFNYRLEEKILKLMGIRYISNLNRNNETELYFRTTYNYHQAVDIVGYNEYISSIYLYNNNKLEKYKLNNDSVKIVLNKNKPAIDILFDKSESLTIPLSSPIDSLIKLKAIANDSIPTQRMTFIAINNKVKVEVRLREIAIQRKENRNRIQHAQLDMLFKWK